MFGAAVNGRFRMVGLRNESPSEVLRQAVYLRSCAGRKTAKPIKERHIRSSPSIQGQWQPPELKSLSSTARTAVS